MKKENSFITLSNISPICLIRRVISNLWIVVIAALISAMLMSLYTDILENRKYSAHITYAVVPKVATTNYQSHILVADSASKILKELVSSKSVLQGIKDSDKELENFDGELEIEYLEDGYMIVVTSVCNTPREAFLSVKALSSLLPGYSEFIALGDALVLVQSPKMDATFTTQEEKRDNCTIAATLGAIAAVAVIIIISIKRETLQTRDGAYELLDSSIIAVINHEDKNRTVRSKLKNMVKSVRVFAQTTSMSYIEQINSLCSQLDFENTTKGHKVILITGVGENEGKSTIAVNVAATLALRGKKVVLIDSDLRKPSLNKIFDDIYKAPLPLNRLLSRPFSEANMLDCIRKHEKLGLYMMFSKKYDSRSTELLTSDTMKKMIEKLGGMDFVILDSPPMGICPDAEVIADLADASILVVRQDNTPAKDINGAIDTLRSSKAEFLGCVLNDMRESGRIGVSKYGYGKYGYGNYGKYGASAADRFKTVGRGE